MHDSLYIFLNSNSLIYSRQSGFRKGHSTETALIKIIDDLLFNLDEDKVSGMILVDYQKAFDMLWAKANKLPLNEKRQSY